MKKTMLLALALFSAVFSLRADEESFAFTFWFNSPADEANCHVEGIKLGIPVSAGKKKVKGAELALCYNEASSLKGLQFALIGGNRAENVRGAQIALLNFMENMDKFGMQWGLYNQSEKSGVQIGFINNGKNNALFQLGLVNINKNGLLPVMIFVNLAKDFFD